MKKLNRINFNADNLIIVWYPQYAGGKFIMNCLSLSRHCTPIEIESCKHLLNYPTDYNYRLAKILSTLPSKDNMTEWLSYEFHTGKFYGADNSSGPELLAFKRMYSGKLRDTGPYQSITQLIDKNINFFAETRGDGKILSQYLSLWPNAKIIKLINVEKFQTLAVYNKQKNNIKRPMSYYCGNECKEKYDSFKGNDWPDWEIFEKNDYNIDKVAKHVTISDKIVAEIKQFYSWHTISNPIFNIDVDETYFDKEKFFIQIRKLYDWLGYDDFNETLLSRYYTAYIDLHKT